MLLLTSIRQFIREQDLKVWNVANACLLPSSVCMWHGGACTTHENKPDLWQNCAKSRHFTVLSQTKFCIHLMTPLLAFPYLNVSRYIDNYILNYVMYIVVQRNFLLSLRIYHTSYYISKCKIHFWCLLLCMLVYYCCF